MPNIEIDDLAKMGVVKDEPGYQLAPEVWTTADNFRSRDNGMEVIPGWASVFGTPGVAPHFALPIISSSQGFWLYTSLTKGYVYDGSSHVDITRAVGGDYTAVNSRDWNGTLFGGVPILNNGSDTPQYWGTLSTGTKLANMTNWPAGGKANVIRAFGAYLIAINYTVGGVNYPHLVKWSASANGPGQLPPSWDDTDASLDAGEYDLPDVNAGILRDALTLGSKLFLYKDQSIWAVRYVGGRAIFAFDTYLDTAGILAPRCVTITGDGKKHVVATQDDIIIHNGSADPVSILQGKMRRSLFQNIDTTNYLNSFLFTDAENSEVIFAYPESGHTNPNRGLVFNYRNGALSECDVGYRYATSGRIESVSSEAWSDGTDVWDTDTGPWSLQERRKVVFCDTDNTLFHKYGSVYTRNGVPYTATLQRVGLALVGRKRTGEWIVDHEVMKFVDRLWPKVRGAPLQVRIGFQMLVDGPVTWGAYTSFDPAVGVTADVEPGSGRAVAIEFYLPIAAASRIDGYKLNVTPDGNF